MSCPFWKIHSQLDRIVSTLQLYWNNFSIPKRSLPYNKTKQEVQEIFLELRKIPYIWIWDKKNHYRIIGSNRQWSVKTEKLTENGGKIFEEILRQHSFSFKKIIENDSISYEFSDSEMATAAVLWIFAVEAIDSVLTELSKRYPTKELFSNKLPQATLVLMQLASIPSTMQSYITMQFTSIMKSSEWLDVVSLLGYYEDTRFSCCPGKWLIPGLVEAVAHLYIPKSTIDTSNILQQIKQRFLRIFGL